jgi:5-formyltetrahydrofolate cyclo-ligase
MPHNALVDLRERASIRKDMRARRRGLPLADRQHLDAGICRTLRNIGPYRHARHLAVYFAFDGEPAIDAVIAAALSAGKVVYTPVIEGQEMSFAPLTLGARLVRNFFGILEADSPMRVDPRELDMVIAPLVAFDATGTRIGVGRAYYDRCFRFLRLRRRWRRPKLIGAGYAFQQIEDAHRNLWDVPLWGVVTEEGLSVFSDN